MEHRELSQLVRESYERNLQIQNQRLNRMGKSLTVGGIALVLLFALAILIPLWFVELVPFGVIIIVGLCSFLTTLTAYILR